MEHCKSGQLRYHLQLDYSGNIRRVAYWAPPSVHVTPREERPAPQESATTSVSASSALSGFIAALAALCKEVACLFRQWGARIRGVLRFARARSTSAPAGPAAELPVPSPDTQRSINEMLGRLGYVRAAGGMPVNVVANVTGTGKSITREIVLKVDRTL